MRLRSTWPMSIGSKQGRLVLKVTKDAVLNGERR